MLGRVGGFLPGKAFLWLWMRVQRHLLRCKLPRRPGTETRLPASSETRHRPVRSEHGRATEGKALVLLSLTCSLLAIDGWGGLAAVETTPRSRPCAALLTSWALPAHAPGIIASREGRVKRSAGNISIIIE